MTSLSEPEPAARRPARVLVVDDEPSIRELLAMLCAYEGWEVATADAGEPALRSARALPPDVVLLDLMLPDMDGLTVLRRLRAEHPAVAVLVVSARGAAGDRRAVLAAGAAGYVAKPFGLAALADDIRRVLDGAAASAPVTTGNG